MLIILDNRRYYDKWGKINSVHEHWNSPEFNYNSENKRKLEKLAEEKKQKLEERKEIFRKQLAEEKRQFELELKGNF